MFYGAAVEIYVLWIQKAYLKLGIRDDHGCVEDEESYAASVFGFEFLARYGFDRKE